MAYSDYYLQGTAGNVGRNASSVQVVGRNAAVGISFIPISTDGIFRTPQAANATQLRIKAGNTNDTAAGSGARSITLEGINASGVYVTETLTTAGTSASALSTNYYIRLFKAYVATCGSYGSITQGGHTASVVIEKGVGGEDWATIDVTDFARGSTETGVYTIPKGKTGYISSLHYGVDTSKTTSIILFQRQCILDAAAPYCANRKVWGVDSTAAAAIHDFELPLGPFPALTDIGVLAKVSATTSVVTMSFELLLMDAD